MSPAKPQPKLEYTKEYVNAPFEETFIWSGGKSHHWATSVRPRRFASYEDYLANKPVKMYKD